MVLERQGVDGSAAPAMQGASRWPGGRLAAAVLVMLAACSGADKAPEPAAAVVVTPAVRVADGEKLLFRYFSGGLKAPKTAESIAQIPADAREVVIVIPDAAEVPPGHVLVADLRTAGADGAYPYRLLAQAELDAELARTRVAAIDSPPAGGVAAAGGQAPAGSSAQVPGSATGGKNDIVMFSASWCGVCKQAKRWFRNKGIDVVERDVEAEPKAPADMADYARRAGVDPRSLTGVPVIWVNGQLFPGFDPGRITAALH